MTMSYMLQGLIAFLLWFSSLNDIFAILFFFGFCRNYNSESEQSEVGLTESSAKSFRFYNAITEGSTLYLFNHSYCESLICSLNCAPR